MAKLIGNAPNQVPTNADLGSMAFEDKKNYATISSSIHQPYRNIIINGDMSIAQRGTNATSLSSNGYFTVDRWKSIHGVGLGVWTDEQSTDVPTGQGFSHSFKATCTTADASPASGDIVQLIQEIEGQNMVSLKKGTANAEPVALSFWVKSNVTGTYTVEWRDADNNRHICASYTITTNDTWEKKTITFTGDTLSAFVYDNTTCGNIGFCYGAGSNFTSGTLATSWSSRNIANSAVGQVNVGASINNYFQITGVQLEVGSAASDFEFLPYDVNLNRCLRYYQQTGSCSGRSFNTTSAELYYTFHQKMRATPSLTLIDGTTSGGENGGVMHVSGVGSDNITSVNGDKLTTISCTLVCTGAGGLFSAGEIVGIQGNPCALSSEL